MCADANDGGKMRIGGLFQAIGKTY